MSDIINEDDYYQFYFTGIDKDKLFNGIKVKLNLQMTPSQCINTLRECINNIVDTKDKQIHVYLAGGVPFIAGTLGDFYLNENLSPKKVIYAILTRHIPESIIKKCYAELCNISDPDRRLLVSPNVESSERGFSDIACFLGYLNHNGITSIYLLKSFVEKIYFPPLITSIERIIDRNYLSGRDIITVTSTLYTFYRSCLPATIPDKKVFEYTFYINNLFLNETDTSEEFPIQFIEVIPNNEFGKFLSHQKLGRFAYLCSDLYNYQSKTNSDFKIESTDSIEECSKTASTFTPISPFSIQNTTDCSIIKGKEHEFLYLPPLKHTDKRYFANIIDPMTGLAKLTDIELFSKTEQIQKSDYKTDLIDPNLDIEQIIMINYDISSLMITDIEGKPQKSDSLHRSSIAYQYLTTFLDKIFGNHIPCILGILAFNGDFVIKCPFSSFYPNIDHLFTDDRNNSGESKIYDSISYSCKEIFKFKEKWNSKYKKCISRILIISNGKDFSTTLPSDLINDLNANEIILDNIVISSESNKTLCALSHITEGISIQGNDLIESLKIISTEAFLRNQLHRNGTSCLIPRSRSSIPSRLRKTQITEELIQRISENSEHDTIKNLIFQKHFSLRISLPIVCLYNNVNSYYLRFNQRRIMKEIRIMVKITDEYSPFYDPDLLFFVYPANLDIWYVFIKGCEGTPYENKWWILMVTFPRFYPYFPPILRFITIPYHINVAYDGQICSNIIDKEYNATKHVATIIQELKKSLFLPNIETPIQIDIYENYLNDREKYNKLAKESADQNAIDDCKDYIKNLRRQNVPFDYYYHFFSDVFDQTKNIDSEKDQLILASTGIYYDRNELKKIVSSNENPICIVTGEPLTERPEDFNNI